MPVALSLYIVLQKKLFSSSSIHEKIGNPSMILLKIKSSMMHLVWQLRMLRFIQLLDSDDQVLLL
ncbi:hypothetical protein MA16_Dca023083 [Dendrobium catenatum]|uniref:Uncharacterized protein n=1 Tax=Dendrobium catenatum TaxID=906689 RepID=A0A2I0VCS4_9ASPA|nr:hypothetical protein MA16_Dca023083 [Dendrobium catenatum]